MKKILKLFSIISIILFSAVIVGCDKSDNEHAHSYTESKSNETKHWKECSCGAKSEEESHTFGSWVTTKESTETTDGVKERECSVCHYKETDKIAKHAHSYTETKSNETKHWKECFCGAKSEEENHTFGSWVTTKESTETTDGVKERECSVCHYKETDKIAKHAHSYTEIKSNETKHWKECSCGAKSEEESHTFGNWQTIKEASYTEKGLKKRVCNKCNYEETEDIAIKEITDISTFIKDNNDINIEKLKPLYSGAVKRALTTEDKITNYKWDLGEITNNQISNLKVILKFSTNEIDSYIKVMNVTLNNPISLCELLKVNLTTSSATYSTNYTYNYDATKQHDRDDLMKAILDVAVTDGFQYEMKDVYYTENTQSTDPTLGTIRNFKVIIQNENGIRDMIIRISNSSSDISLINNINNAKYRVSEYNKILDFTSNQLKEVDLTAPTDPNSIEYLIYYHNDEITANLETQYQSVLKSAFGRAYGTSRYEVQTYRWDLGEVVEGKIQNLKMILNYYDNNALSNTLRVYDVTLSESIDLKTLLNASTMSNVKTTNVTSYTYTYDATKQHDREDLIKAILDVAVTDGFKYEMKDVIYKENSASTDPTLGTIKRFSIVITIENAIRGISIGIATGSNDTVLINNINKGKYIVSVTDMVKFTSNQLKEVDLTTSKNN